MSYRVSTSRDGRKRWWQAHDTIPPADTARRPATAAEAAIIDEILATDRADNPPALQLGRRVIALMELTA